MGSWWGKKSMGFRRWTYTISSRRWRWTRKLRKSFKKL